MKYRNRFAVAVLSLLITVAAAPSVSFAGAGDEMTAAAQKLLKSLDADQKAKVVMEYDDPKRTDWHYIPKPTRKGLTLKEMNDEQKKLAMDLLATALSPEAFRKAKAAIELEAVLLAVEKNDRRDPQKYYTTIFGTPTAEGTWGYSFEGHHLSLNWVVRNGKLISATPLFYGANPGVVLKEPTAGLNIGVRPLAAEEQLGFDLLASLTPEQRKAAYISDKPQRDMKEAPKAQAVDAEPQGLPASKMDATQRQTLLKIITAYMGNAPAEVAQPAIAAAELELDSVHFAWWGADQPFVGHAYHITGKTFTLQLYNTQADTNGDPANHPHAVWRTVGHDFGR